MSPLSRGRARRALLAVLVAVLAVTVALDLLAPDSVIRGLFASPDVREPVVPEVDDVVRELQKGPPVRR